MATLAMWIGLDFHRFSSHPPAAQIGQRLASSIKPNRRRGNLHAHGGHLAATAPDGVAGGGVQGGAWHRPHRAVGGGDFQAPLAAGQLVNHRRLADRERQRPGRQRPWPLGALHVHIRPSLRPGKEFTPAQLKVKGEREAGKAEGRRTKDGSERRKGGGGVKNRAGQFLAPFAKWREDSVPDGPGNGAALRENQRKRAELEGNL